MSNILPNSITEILNRILDYLKDDEGIDMVYLNNELVNLSECIDRAGIKKARGKRNRNFTARN